MTKFETLESRRMLAATLSSNGTLNIRATSRDDVIRLGFDDTFVNTIAATINGEQRLFQGRDVKRINLDALTGHDRIYVDRSLSGLGGIKLNIDSGRGNDQIRLENLGRIKVTIDELSDSDRLITDQQTNVQYAFSGSISTTANTTGNISITASVGTISLLNPIPNSGSGAGNVTIGAPSNSGNYGLSLSALEFLLLNHSANPQSDSTAIAYINDSLLLFGSNANSRDLVQSPLYLSDKLLKNIKPGIVSVDESWELTRVGTKGEIVWLKVRGNSIRRNLGLETSIFRFDGKTVDPSKYPAGAKERKLKVSFMAVHRDSLLAIGGLTGESAVPIAPSYLNANAAVFASGAKLRLMNDWSDAHSVSDKIPLAPGVNPHGRRGIIVDDGIIWFDDVDRPYFQKIDL